MGAVRWHSECWVLGVLGAVYVRVLGMSGCWILGTGSVGQCGYCVLDTSG